HGKKHLVQARFPGHVLKSFALLVSVELVSVSPAMRLSLHALDHLRHRQLEVEGKGEDVQPTVIVEIPGPAGKSLGGPSNVHRLGHVAEGAVAIVMEQLGLSLEVVEEQVRIVVVVIVDPGGAL